MKIVIAAIIYKNINSSVKWWKQKKAISVINDENSNNSDKW